MRRRHYHARCCRTASPAAAAVFAVQGRENVPGPLMNGHAAVQAAAQRLAWTAGRRIAAAWSRLGLSYLLLRTLPLRYPLRLRRPLRDLKPKDRTTRSAARRPRHHRPRHHRPRHHRYQTSRAVSLATQEEPPTASNGAVRAAVNLRDTECQGKSLQLLALPPPLLLIPRIR